MIRYKYFCLCFLFFSGFAFSLFSQNTTEKDLSKNKFNLLENNLSILEFENTIDDYFISDISSAEGNFSRILLGNGYIYSGKPGSPELPLIQRMIELPLGAEISIKIITDKVATYDLKQKSTDYKLYPTQPSTFKNSPSSSFVMDTVIYSSNKFFSNPLVDVVKLGSLRGTQIARLNISPVEYNPVQNKIVIHKYLKVQISFNGGNIEKTLYEKSRVRSPYHDFSTQSVLNKSHRLLRFDTIVNTPVKYVIVSSPEFKETLRPFVKWKTQKGFQVLEVYTDDPAVGTTRESIKAYLQQLYNSATPDNPAPIFLLIVGDTPQIPSFRMPPPASSGLNSYYTDLYYAEYTGDYFPELFYGRFSARDNTQLKNMINKTIEYEKYEMSNTSYLHKVLLVAGQDNQNQPTSGITTNGFINYMKSNYFPINPNVDTSFYYNESSYQYANDIRAEINQGKALISYTSHCNSAGWGTPSFSTSHANALTNYHQYFFSVNNCCSSSKFDDPECFGEALLRIANAGAIGIIGASNETLWEEDYYWGVGSKNPVTINPVYNANTLGAFDRFFHTHNEPLAEQYVTQGEMVQAGNMAVSQSSSYYEKYYWEIYNLLGDPSLSPYIGIPNTQHFDIPDSIERGTQEINAHGTPLSYIAVFKDSLLLGVGLSNADGYASIKIQKPLLTDGYIYVNASKQFHQIYKDSIFVYTPFTAKVVQASYEFTDSSGNIIQKIQSGQLVKVNMTLQNVGNLKETNLVTKLENINTLCLFEKDTHIWDTINTNETVSQENVFIFRADEGIEDMSKIWFNLQISGNDSYLYESLISTMATAPKLDLGNIIVDKIPSSGPFVMNISVKNTGSLEATNTYCKLTPNSENVTFSGDSVLFVGTLLPKEERVISFPLIYMNNTEKKSIAANISLFSDHQYSITKSFSFYTETHMETFELGDFSHYSWTNDGRAPWTIDNTPSNVFKGNFSAKSGVIGDNASSTLSINMNVVTQDSIRFALKVSSENGYDFFGFYIDDTLKEKWSGTVNWKTVAYIVQPGKHTFKWVYWKDANGSGGADAAWIDEIIFPIFEGEINVPVIPAKTNDLSVLLYPNPVKDELNIDVVLASRENIVVEIYNSLGQQMCHKVITNIIPSQKHHTTLNVSDYTNGIYYAVIYTNNELITRKFIIVK